MDVVYTGIPQTRGHYIMKSYPLIGKENAPHRSSNHLLFGLLSCACTFWAALLGSCLVNGEATITDTCKVPLYGRIVTQGQKENAGITEELC